MTTNIADLANAINDMLHAYANDVGEKADEVAHEIAKEGVKKLKQISPELTGDYKKSWRVKKTKKRKGRIRANEGYVVHNKDHYRLTHLLEKGHASSDGTGRVNPIIHIEPVEQDMIRDFETRLSQAVGSR